MNEVSKRVKVILAIVFFPIFFIYCILHTFGKEVVTFFGSLLIAIGGLVGGIYLTLTNPLFIEQALNWVQEAFYTIITIFN